MYCVESNNDNRDNLNRLVAKDPQISFHGLTETTQLLEVVRHRVKRCLNSEDDIGLQIDLVLLNQGLK